MGKFNRWLLLPLLTRIAGHYIFVSSLSENKIGEYFCSILKFVKTFSSFAYDSSSIIFKFDRLAYTFHGKSIHLEYKNLG